MLCLVVAALLAVSCSENVKMKNLLEQVPANADIVLVGNVKTVIESAGGSIENSKIKLPSNLMDALPASSMSAVDEANDFLKKAGIDMETCALFFNYEEKHPVLVFALSDRKQFIDAIEDNGFKEKDTEGNTVYYVKKVYEDTYNPDYDDYGYIAVNDSYAYWIERVWVGRDFLTPIRYLQKKVEDAREKSFASTNYADYITEGNAGGVAVAWPKELKRELRRSGMPSDMLAIYDGVICMRGKLSSNECTVEAKLFDEDGKEIGADVAGKFMDVSATISGKALSMLGEDEFMVYAMSMKHFNWDKYADALSDASGLSRSDRAQMNAILSYFEKIDGTVALGFGLTNGLESIENMDRGRDVMSQFSTTTVIETKEGKTRQLVEDMKGFLEQARIPFNESGSGFSMSLRSLRDTGMSGEWYVKAVDNFLVVANHPIKENNNNALIKSTDLTDYLFAFCIGLNKQDRLMRDLGVNNDVKLTMGCKPKTLESAMTLEIDGDRSTGVIAKAIKIALGIAANAEELERRLSGRRNYVPEPDYYYDEEVEEVVVEEEYGDSVAYYDY